MRPIACGVFKCDRPASRGALFRHESSGAVAHPVYYYCSEHVTATTGALESWKVEQ